MKFGIREVCDCVFTSLDGKGPNFVIDTATMSSIESSATTVYAQGGKGYARLAAWEGEKVLTFTIESAILTPESLSALVGGKMTNGKIQITTKDFAGYYGISAHTLIRETEDGEDKAALITIPKAKLQSNINLSMAPNGDPSSFTFTFDAFEKDGLLCEIAIQDGGTTTATNNSEKTIATLFDDNGIFQAISDDALTLASASWTALDGGTGSPKGTKFYDGSLTEVSTVTKGNRVTLYSL